MRGATGGGAGAGAAAAAAGFGCMAFMTVCSCSFFNPAEVNTSRASASDSLSRADSVITPSSLSDLASAAQADDVPILRVTSS